MTDHIVTSAEDFTIFPKTLTFDAELGSTLDIVDRWRDGETIYLRIRNPKTAATERYRVSQVFSLADGERYIVLSTSNLPDESMAMVIFALPEKNHLATLTPEKFKQLSSQLEIFQVADDYEKVSDYLGTIDDRTARLPKFKSYLKEALTSELCFEREVIQPGSTVVIERKWQHFNTVFLDLRKTNHEMTYPFRLVWIFQLGGHPYAVLAYPPEVTAESDVVPRLLLRLIDENNMQVVDDSVVDFNLKGITDIIAARNDIAPDEAAQYLGFIASP